MKSEYLSCCAVLEYSKLHGWYLVCQPGLLVFVVHELNVVAHERQCDEGQSADEQQDGNDGTDSEQQRPASEGDSGEGKQSKDEPNGVLLVLREVLEVQFSLSVS